MENLTSVTFKEKIFDYSNNNNFVGSKPAIIDFYADWCGPCRMVAPILEELSKEYPGIDFYKVNTEEESEIAAAFKIRSIPTILFVPLTGMPQTVVGAIPKTTLKQTINNVFGL